MGGLAYQEGRPPFDVAQGGELVEPRCARHGPSNSVAQTKMMDCSPKPKLLLHICCGPCATAVIERLCPSFDVHCFWYNPNIEPAAEYDRRLASMRTVARAMEVPLVEGDRDTADWRRAIAGWENEPEGGRRCAICFEYRLRGAVEYAYALGIGYFAATLSVSPHKDAALINSLGARLGEAAGIEFVAENWREQNGFERSVELCKQLGLYRQNYCGCIFSLRGAARQPRASARAEDVG